MRALMTHSTLALFVALAGCAGALRADLPGQALGHAGELVCTPSTLGPGDVLTLTMRTPHGSDLAVIAPDGTYYFLVLDGTSPADAIPLPAGDFGQVERIELRVDDAVALPWEYGAEAPERIFRTPGRYRIHLSENLETDDGTPLAECVVHLITDA